MTSPKLDEGCHPSHVTRVSDASSFDEICTNCGATDITGGGWGKLAEPCPAVSTSPDERMLEIAREAVAAEADQLGFHVAASGIRKGQWDNDKDIQVALSAIRAYAASQGDAGAVVAWAYEHHEFDDVWARHVILNNPDGSANPPTKHHGSAVRNVRPLYATPSPSPDRELVEGLEPNEDEVAAIARWMYEADDHDGYSIPWGSPKNAKVRANTRNIVRTVLRVRAERALSRKGEA